VRVRRLLDGLAALRDDYRDRGSDLRRRPRPLTVLPELAAALDAERVVWNQDYSGLARERDAGVRTALNDAGIDREVLHDAVLLHTPESIRTNAGDPYSVYSYYWKKWTDRVADPPAPTPDAGDLVDAGDLTAAVGTDGGAETDGGAAIDRVAVGDPACARRFGVRRARSGCRSRRHRGGPRSARRLPLGGGVLVRRRARLPGARGDLAHVRVPEVRRDRGARGVRGDERRDGDGGGKDRGARRGR